MKRLRVATDPQTTEQGRQLQRAYVVFSYGFAIACTTLVATACADTPDMSGQSASDAPHTTTPAREETATRDAPSADAPETTASPAGAEPASAPDSASDSAASSAPASSSTPESRYAEA